MSKESEYALVICDEAPPEAELAFYNMGVSAHEYDHTIHEEQAFWRDYPAKTDVAVRDMSRRVSSVFLGRISTYLNMYDASHPMMGFVNYGGVQVVGEPLKHEYCRRELLGTLAMSQLMRIVIDNGGTLYDADELGRADSFMEFRSQPSGYPNEPALHTKSGLAHAILPKSENFSEWYIDGEHGLYVRRNLTTIPSPAMMRMIRKGAITADIGNMMSLFPFLSVQEPELSQQPAAHADSPKVIISPTSVIPWF